MTCSIALGFICASLFIPPIKLQGLDPQQQHIYDSIVQERKRIYMTGLIVGGVLGAVVWLKTKKQCHALSTLFVTTYFVYKLLPKSAYMLEHLREDQIPQWTEINRKMSLRYHIGFIVGLFLSLIQGVQKTS